jgi:hypothetical protein
MSTVLRFLPALTCAGVMFFCMRGMRRNGPNGVNESRNEEVARLRSEVEDLRPRLDPSTVDDHR